MKIYSPKSLILMLGALLLCTVTVRGEELDWAQKMFTPLKHDFGVVARGADVRTRIILKNIYKEPITITEVKTSCGCISASASSKLLKMHEEGYIEASLDTVKYKGQRDVNVDVTVTFDNRTYKTVRVPISAYIRSDVVMTPGAATFGTVDLGSPASKSLKVEYAGRQDWTVKEVRSDSPYLKTTFKEINRGGGRVGYEVTVTLADNAPAGTISEQITLVTDDSNPFVPVNVNAVVESDIVVSTPVVALGEMTPGVAKTVRAVVRGRKPFVINQVNCDSNRNCFKCNLNNEEKTVHVVPIVVTPPAESGEFTEEFTVHIEGRNETVSFRAEGTIK